MARSKIAITIDEGMLSQLDDLVRRKVFNNRSQAFQSALEEKLGRLSRRRLAAECARLDPDYEKAMAEEGMSEELGEWPEY